MSDTLATPVWIQDPDDFYKAVEHCVDSPWVLDTETDGLRVRQPGEDKAWYIGLMPVGLKTCFILTRSMFERVRSAVEGLQLVGHNIRFDMHALDLSPKHTPIDTMVAGYFGHTTRRLSLDHFARTYGWSKIKTPDKIKQGRILEMDPHEVALYLADDCLVTSFLYQKMMELPFGGSIKKAEPDYEVEVAVHAMEARGVKLIESRLRTLGAKIQGLANDSLVDLRAKGMTGDPNSPKQVGAWLMSEGRRLPLTEKGNPSTAKMVLQRMSDNGDSLALLLLEYRGLSKLISAFIEPLPRLAVDGMLYPQVNTTRTKTGRFSYSEPNLQQIPKRSGSLAKSFRQCFTSSSGHVSGADYSQVELRVAAALSGEPVLLDAFIDLQDPHTQVAAKMLGKSVGSVTPEERFGAKAVNFGILNGMGAKRLSHELKSSYDEAAKFLDDYRRGLPHLTEWMEGIWRMAEVDDVVRTLAGRTRVFGPDESTRSAISVIVQGTAAELMRHALVAVEREGLQPILVVHDEIVCDGFDKGYEVATIMRDAANEAYPELATVDFAADPGQGETWADI